MGSKTEVYGTRDYLGRAEGTYYSHESTPHCNSELQNQMSEKLIWARDFVNVLREFISTGKNKLK